MAKKETTKLSRTLHKIRTPISLINSLLRGGCPFGGLFQFWGASKSGKSTAALQTARYFLDDYPNGRVVIIDSEGNYSDSSRLEKVFDLHPHDSVLETLEEDERVFFLRCSVIEQAFSIMTKFVKESQDEVPTLIILDSISSLSAQATVDEVNKSAAKGTAVNVYAGGQSVNASLITKLLGPLMGDVSNSWTSIIFINQITIDRSNSYMPQEIAKGGFGLRHSLHLSIKFDILQSSQKGNSDKDTGTISSRFSENSTSDETIKPHTISVVRMDKNKYGISDSGAAAIYIDNLSGGKIQEEFEIMDCLAKTKGLIYSAGSWWKFNDTIKEKYGDLKLSYTDSKTGEITEKSVQDSWLFNDITSSEDAYKLLKKEVGQYYLGIQAVKNMHDHMVELAEKKGIDISDYLNNY